MAKFALYGLAALMETGIGFCIFGKIFPKRIQYDKKFNMVCGCLIFLLMTGMYKMTKCMLGDRVNNWNSVGRFWVCCSVLLLIITVHGMKNKKEKMLFFLQIVFFIIIALDLTEQYWMSYQSIAMMIMGNIFPPLYLYLFFQCTFAQAYLWEVVYVVNIGFVKEVYIAYTGVFQNRRFEDFFYYPRIHSQDEIIFFLIICFGLLLISRVDSLVSLLKKLLMEHKKKLFILIWIEIFLLMGVANLGEGEIDRKKLALTLAALTGIMMCIFIAYIRLQQRINEAENNILNVRYDVIKAQYEELKSAYEGYRCLVHDEKHLISYVAECLDNGNVEEVQKFLNNYQATSLSRNRITWTGISTLDFMLSIKNRKMKRTGISFKLDALVENIPMEDSDCIMLMGNLLDNAIEAADKCEDGRKNIYCVVRNVNDMLIIKVKNSSISAPIVRKGRFLTNKKEKEKHGWGIESVKRIVEKYDGEIDFQYGSTYFETVVIIGNEE